MKALTLSQPYASAIIDGPKRIENRSWPCPDKNLGWIAVHAGKGKYPHDQAALKRLWPQMPPLADMPKGVLLGAMFVWGCWELNTLRHNGVDPGPWGTGPWIWMISTVRKLPEPIECRGRQKLWDTQALENILSLRGSFLANALAGGRP